MTAFNHAIAIKEFLLNSLRGVIKKGALFWNKRKMTSSAVVFTKAPERNCISTRSGIVGSLVRRYQKE